MYVYIFFLSASGPGHIKHRSYYLADAKPNSKTKTNPSPPAITSKSGHCVVKPLPQKAKPLEHSTVEDTPMCS